MRNVVYFILLGLFWGGSFVGIKYSIGAFSPLIAGSFRIGICLAFLTVLLPLMGKSYKIPKRMLPKVWLVGLLMVGLPQSLLFIGIQSVSAGIAGVIDGTVAVWVFLLGLIVLRKHESYTLQKFAGLLLGLTGIIVLFYPALSFSIPKDEISGMFIILLMAFSYTFGTIGNRFLLQASKETVDLYGCLYQQCLMSFLFILALSIVFEDWGAVLPLTGKATAVKAVLYLGICSTALAWVFYFNLIRNWGAVRAVAVTFTTPPLSLLLDFLFFGTRPNIYEIAGVCLIIPAVMLIQLERKPRLTS